MQYAVHNMRAHVVNLVRDTIRKYCSTEISDFDEICSGLGLDVKEVELDLETDGMRAGRTILINLRIRNEERKQFTRFHEVMHHLIDADGDLNSMLCNPTLKQRNGHNSLLEQLCNIGAAEFLMPREEITRLYEGRGFGVELIPSASRRFGCSAIATTIQLAQVAPHSCITAICEYGLIPNETSPDQNSFLEDRDSTLKKKLHVVYSASSPAAKYWLARYTRIPDDHLINEAFSKAQSFEGESYVPFRSGNQMPCYCEALPDKDRVYVLFHLTPRLNPDQLSLI